MENRRSGSDGTPVVLLLLHHLLLPQLQPQQSLSRQLVRGSSRESTTGTQDRSTDISIHLSPARRGEPDSLGADSVAPTIRLHHSPKQQNLPDAYHKQGTGTSRTLTTLLDVPRDNANPNSPPLPNPVALDRIHLFVISFFQFSPSLAILFSWVFSVFASLISVLVSV
jgi:hypothetical protein